MNYGENRLTVEKLKEDSQATVIIGPNGSGKTASIKSLKKELEENGETVIKFSSRKDDALSTMGSPFRNTTTRTSLLSIGTAFLSEGERINMSFDVYFMEEIVPQLHANKKDTCWLLLDEFDSGLSYDRLYRLLEHLARIQFLEKDMAGRTLKIILTANSYELVEIIQLVFKNTSIFNVELDNYVEIHSYEEFKSMYFNRLDYLKKEDNE